MREGITFINVYSLDFYHVKCNGLRTNRRTTGSQILKRMNKMCMRLFCVCVQNTLYAEQRAQHCATCQVKLFHLASKLFV